MLVLSRKRGERLLIGDYIEITVVRIGPNAVRLGVKAPSGMKIVREELVEKTHPIQASNDDLTELGRRLTDEAENGFIPPGACVIADEV